MHFHVCVCVCVCMHVHVCVYVYICVRICVWLCVDSKILQMEEEFIKKMCDEVIALKPDLVITEKGVSDLAQHFLVKAGISAVRRVRKSDNNRIARYSFAVDACLVSFCCVCFFKCDLQVAMLSLAALLMRLIMTLKRAI